YLVVVLTIVGLSLAPGDWRPSIGLAKALEHLVAYFIAAAVLTTACRARWPQIAGLIVLAGVLEIGQGWVPGQDSKLAEFVGSSIGALLGFGFSALTLAGHRALSSARTVWGAALRPRPSRLAGVGAVIAIGAALVVISIATIHGAAGWLGAG